MNLSLYFSCVLLIISSWIVIKLVRHENAAGPVLLYWIVQVIRYMLDVLK